MTVLVVVHGVSPLLSVLDGAIYLQGHPHHADVGEVIDAGLLSHLYGTGINVVRTATGDLNSMSTRSASSVTSGPSR
jgi:zinc/manganese transport system ATP-binding protein